ncbi:MAG: hypothetical protein H0X69_15780 [Gemmatimonadales bacterium]|nr:hypothetical protein [Gemmatimonadales bacterium]
MRHRAWRFPPIALGLLLACGGSDGFSPTEETVAGTYQASTFTVTSTIGSTDLLTAGATVDVTLAPDGTASGRLFVPGAGEGGADLDEDLTGTWTLSGETVTFDQTADTFIRDADFIAGRDTLTGEGTFDGLTVFLQLIKTE